MLSLRRTPDPPSKREQKLFNPVWLQDSGCTCSEAPPVCRSSHIQATCAAVEAHPMASKSCFGLQNIFFYPPANLKSTDEGLKLRQLSLGSLFSPFEKPIWEAEVALPRPMCGAKGTIVSPPAPRETHIHFLCSCLSQKSDPKEELEGARIQLHGPGGYATVARPPPTPGIGRGSLFHKIAQ